MKAIIIDDEKDAITAMSIMLTEFVDDITIVGTANSALEGIKLINSTSPDVVFLDIEMPYGNGFDLLDSIVDRNFYLVFTTAYEQYAIKAIKENAFDYLLKPIDIDELNQLIDKINAHKKEQGSMEHANSSEGPKLTTPNKISIALNGDYLFLDLEDIQYIKSEGSYSIIHTFDKKYTTAKNLKYHEELLADNNFMRVSNSYLINLEKVIKYVREDGGMLELQNKSRIPIARNRKKEIKRVLNF